MLKYKDQHDLALGLACQAMTVDAAAGCSIGAWREGVLDICRKLGFQAPDDVLAWVSGGKASDAEVADWSQRFGVR